MDHLSAYGEADKPPPSPPKESEPVEEPRNDTSVSPDLPQGGITGPSTSVPADPAQSIPSTLDPSPQASQPVPEGLKESSSLCPLPPPKEEPYDSYQRTGRKRIDFVKKTARPAVAALPQNCKAVPAAQVELPLHLSQQWVPLFQGIRAPTRCGSWVPLMIKRHHGPNVRPVQNKPSDAPGLGALQVMCQGQVETDGLSRDSAETPVPNHPLHADDHLHLND